MNVAGKIVEILEEEGILDVFGIPGEQIMPLSLMSLEFRASR